MKNIFLLLAGVVALASCSSPKYTYHFDHYDYNSGKKQSAVEVVQINPDEAGESATMSQEVVAIERSPLALTPESLSADAGNAPVMTESKSLLSKKYTDLSRSEKKEFRKELKTELKKYIKARKADDSGAITKETKAMDYNLKMAIIFGAVALTLSFFGGVNSVFWVLSVIALVIGVVFFIKWIAEL